MDSLHQVTTRQPLMTSRADYDVTMNGSVNTTGNVTDCLVIPDDISTPWLEFIPVLTFYGFTLLFGVTGNSLVIFTIVKNESMQNVTNIFLTSLASADLLLVVLCVPVKVAKFLSFTWRYGRFLCKAVHYMQNLSVICSVLTLTFMSIERYYAIVYPMKFRVYCTATRTKKVIVLIWIASLAFAIPILFGQVMEPVGVYCTELFWCVEKWSTPLVFRTYEVGMLFVILIFPLSVMSYTYSAISRILWHGGSIRDSLFVPPEGDNSMRRHSATHVKITMIRRRPRLVSEDETTKEQVIKMLLIVVCLFTLCWTPILVDNVLVAFGILEDLHHGYLKPMRQAFWVMAYFNSCVNPWVYAFMSHRFRERFRAAVCCACAQTWRQSSTKMSYV